MKSKAKLVVAACALIGASSVAAWHVMRDRLSHAGDWNDALGTSFSLEDTALRHAVFGEPEALSGPINTPSDETRATRSSDGRHLVFEVGTRGANTELWIGECVGDTVRALRLLTELDTTADECAPSFAAGFLLFSSDRPGGAGGLDLYRSRFDGTTFGAVERLDGSLQSPRDDTDPTPWPGTSEIVFASDREGVVALYRADGEGSDRAPVRVDGLPDGAREPSFAADGRTLWFALERGGSFDIHRALKHADAFVDTGPVPGLDSALDERAPLALSDGFELLFARAGAATRGFDLARVRAAEVLRVPSRRWTWIEIATIAALLVLALMAFLSDRWPALDTLYRCYLASVLIHLVLALWMQHVYVERGTPSTRDGGRKVRVKLIQPANSLSNRERAGDVGAAPDSALVALEKADISRPTDPAPLEAAELSIAELLPIPTPAPSAPPRETASAALARTSDSDLRLRDLERTERVLAPPAPVLEIGASALAEAPRDTTLAQSRSEFGAVVTPSREPRAQPLQLEAPALSLPVAVVPRDRSLPTSSAGEERILDHEVSSPRGARRSSDPTASESNATWIAELGPISEAKDTQEAPTRAGFAPLESDSRTSAPTAAVAAPSVELTPRDVERAPVTLRETQDPSSLGLLDRERVVASSEAPPKDNPAHDLLGDLAMPKARSVEASAPERADFAPTSRDETPPRAELESLVAAPPEKAPHAPPPARVDWAGTPYENRVGGAKERALEDHGGSAATERAVQRGLEYLASIQAGDGHFGPAAARDPKYGQIAIGKTGLALLAFLGAGHTPGSNTEFSTVTERALAFLVDAQHDVGGHIGDGDAYSHGIATYALAEAYALTKDARWRAPLERAVARIVAAQSRSKDARLFGGWGYYFADGHSFDRWSRASITAWQVMALESARLGGLSIDGRVFEDAAQFLEGCRDAEADYVRYSHDPARLGSEYPTLPASTPAALFALSILGRDVQKSEYASLRRFVLERAPRGFRFTNERDFVQRGQGNPYFHYYGTLALFRVGGGAWQTWNEALKRSLLPAQDADGSWTPIDVYARYGRDDEEDKSYTTALCVLSLEIYYRYYLPLLKAGEAR